MKDKIIKLLNLYLNDKLRLKPYNSEDDIKWECEECMECGSVTWVLKINDFEPGIKITEGELLSFILDNNIHFD